MPVVSLYENGISSEFLLPGQPGKPRASKVTSTSIQLVWDKPKLGANNITSYTVLYKQDSAGSRSSDEWLSLPLVANKRQCCVILVQKQSTW